MIASLVSLLAAAAILLAAFGLGRPIWRGLRTGHDDPLETTVWSVGLGLVAFGTLWTLLGVAGLLYRELIAVLTVAAAFWALGEWLQASMQRSADRRLARRTPTKPEEPTSRIAAPSENLLKLLAACCFVALLASLTSALAPPTAGDALCYHLELPKRFLAEHRLAFLPDHENSTFPLLVEMWYLWALALDGGVAAQLIHWALGAWLALSAVVLARPIIGRDWAWLAGAIVLLTPGVTNQMTAPLNDVGLATMTTLAVAAWWRAAIDDESPRWYLIAGLFLGAALGTKYLALLFTAAWFGTWIVLAFHQRERLTPWLRGAATMLVLAATLAGPWYARAAWHRGNPVYPFFQSFVDDGATATIRESKLALGRTPWGLAAAPWAVTMSPDRFGGRGHQLGCAFLALLPGVLLARRLRGVRILLGISAAYVLGWFLLRQNVRFLYPLLPLWAAPCAWVWIESRRLPRLHSSLVTLSLLGVVALGALWPVYRARNHWAVALGMESRVRYLQRTEPSYPAALLANLLADEETQILSQDNRGFYFAANVTQESLYRRRTGYNQSGRDLATTLRNDGFQYLLLAESTGDDGIEFDGTLSRLVDRQLRTDGEANFRQLAEYNFQDTDGAARHYRLLRIEPITMTATRNRPLH
jgi:hypothetical protein